MTTSMTSPTPIGPSGTSYRVMETPFLSVWAKKSMTKWKGALLSRLTRQAKERPDRATMPKSMELKRLYLVGPKLRQSR